jgi:hypothetical protein
MAISIHELYADERFSGSLMWLGGLSCSRARAAILSDRLAEIRKVHQLTAEMKWAKISSRYLSAYREWADVFFDDRYVKYTLFRIDRSGAEWNSFQPSPGRMASNDEKLASAYHQFLLRTFGALRDNRRWSVYPDAGLFSRDAVFTRVNFRFNKTYMRAFGNRNGRTIQLIRPSNSRTTDLIQLADVLLGTFARMAIREPINSVAKRAFVEHCSARFTASAVSLFSWVPPERFPYGT